jgi:uncharacterized protein
MTVKSLWQQIKALVDCDKKIATLQEEIATVQAGLEKDKLAQSQYQTIIQEKQRALFNLQKDLQLRELTSQELKDTEDKKRKQLDNAREQKEYKALEKEIGNVSAERQTLDEFILKEWYTVDTLKSDIDDLSKKQEALTERAKIDIALKEENLISLQTKLTTAQKTREEAILQVQPEWRAQYERMRHSVPDPIVPVLNSSCSACFYTISHQDLAKLKKSQLVICRNCYRFLYYDEQEATDATKAEY